MANTEVERRTDVDVEDVPSAEWGWSKENYRLIHIGGLLAAGVLAAHDARQPRRPRRGHLPHRIRRAHRRRGRARLVAAPPRLDQVVRLSSDRVQRTE